MLLVLELDVADLAATTDHGARARPARGRLRLVRGERLVKAVGRALAAMDGPAGAGMTVVRLAGPR